MKVIFLVCLFVAAIHGQDEFKAGTPVAKTTQIRTSRIVRIVSAICNGATKGGKRYCNGPVNPATAKTCEATGFVQCKSSGTTGTEFSCGADTPHCREDVEGEASCSTEPDTSCVPAVSDFLCTGEGVFPDPADCKKYYYCSSDEATADEYACDDLYVFDPSGPKNEYCRLTKNRYCTTANCEGAVKNIVLSYRYFPKSLGEIVASCQGTRPAIMYRCEKGFEANLKSLPLVCNFICTREDKAPFPGNDQKYYACIYNGTKWEGKVKSCFSTYFFNAKTKQCEVKPVTTTIAAG